MKDLCNNVSFQPQLETHINLNNVENSLHPPLPRIQGGRIEEVCGL